MAYMTTNIWGATPRVSADRDFVHIRLDCNTLGLNRMEAAGLAADILDALQVSRFEAVDNDLPPPLAAAVTEGA